MDLIAYGKVVKPHGLTGEVKVLPFSGETSSFKNFYNLYISKKIDNPNKFIISRSRNQKGSIIVKLEGIDTIDDAEKLKGLMVFIDKKELPEKADDEYYWFELEGLQVNNLQGESLGSVVRLMETGANDVLVIKEENATQEVLIPYVKEQVIKQVDLSNRTITVDWLKEYSV